MKKFIILITLSLGLMSFDIQGDPEPIVRAFQSAKAEEVSRYFDDYVDMKLMDKAEVKNIGKNQAGITLKAFFADNDITGFEKASERAVGNTMYMTGKLLNNEKGLGITVLLKSKDGRYQIISIRIG